MRVGVGSYAFRWSIGTTRNPSSDPMGPCAFVAAAAAAGADLVQFAENLPLTDLSDDDVARLAQRASDHGIAIQLGTNTLDEAELARQRDLAPALGADLIRIAPAPADLDGDRAALVERLRSVGDAFGRLGCTVAIENHFLLAPSDLARLIESAAHPHVTACLDVANSVANGQWPEQTIATLAPHAANLHLKDYDIVPDPDGVGMHVVGTRLGEGRMDLSAAIASVVRHGSDIDVIVEHWMPHATGSTESERRALETQWTGHGVRRVRDLIRQWERRQNRGAA